MEISWFGEGCVRLRAREGSVVADPFRTVLGPTGRGVTADIATFSHSGDDGRAERLPGIGDPPELPASLERARVLRSPGEFEVHDVLVTGVRTYRDDARGAERGQNVTFVYELDGLHAVHLGDIGHLLDEEMLGEIGTVDVICLPIGAALSAARAAELVAQIDANLVVPLPVAMDAEKAAADLDRFLHEMGAQRSDPVSRLSVTISSLPSETTLVLLEARNRG